MAEQLEQLELLAARLDFKNKTLRALATMAAYAAEDGSETEVDQPAPWVSG